jgi:cytochrome c-type biogenesis protein CcmH
MSGAKRRSMGTSVAAWVVLAVVTVGALALGTFSGTTPQTPADRVQALSTSIRCPQCLGQSVAESDVTVSREIRRDIARRVEEGQTDDEIRAYYASSFGDDALLSPPTEGIGSVVWILPVVVVIAGGLGLAVALRRWSAGAGGAASADDRALVEGALRRHGAQDGSASDGARGGDPDDAPDDGDGDGGR